MEKSIHEQMVKDLLFMRSRDELWGIKKDESKNALLDMNVRMLQYLSQFHFSIDYFINQILQDFKHVVRVLQQGKEINKALPVAMYNGKPVYINTALKTKEEISLGSPIFITERFME